MAVDFERSEAEYLACGAADQLDNLDNISISFWTYAENLLINVFWYISKGQWFLGFNGSEIYFRQIYSGDDGNWDGSTVLVNNTLYHVVLTYNRGGGAAVDPKMYLNSVEETVSASTPTGTVSSDAGDSLIISIGDGNGID